MDEVAEAVPACPLCFYRLEPAGEAERAWWECADCGWVGLSV